jgi:alanine racemase
MLDRPAWVEVDLSAVSHNVKQIKSLLRPGVKLCAVVKADAYGHGAAQVAREALVAGADMLAVAIVAEAIELRRAGFTGAILVMGRVAPEQAIQAAGWGLIATVFSLEDARALSDAGRLLGQRVALHLKIDTGMERLGAAPEDAVRLALAMAELPFVDLEGAYSHFASADSRDLAFAREQLSIFLDVVARIEEKGISLPCKHMANSAATLALPEAQLDMVRPGVILYGLRPSLEMDLPIFALPAMKLKARVSMVKDVGAGLSIGYGRSYYTSRPSRIATLPLGYADGWPRILSGRATVAIGGGRAPIVGRICMDQFMIDVTDLPRVEAGDEVLMFGEGGPSADEIAAHMGSINYEVVCMMGKRLPRLYRNAGGRESGDRS